MKYKKSKEIFSKIKKAETILINCHRSPDPDSIGSALAFYQAVKELGKVAEIVTPNSIGDNYKFLPYSEKIKKVPP